ncbi:MAG: hypothetical protein HOP31_08710 [Ignavibacteria bacterium]|nr:hypothetical protein [Ignavibacteria bacterium]
MNKSSLIEAVRTFSPKEMKEFSEFVSSPFFNKNVNVVKLFELIKKNYPELDSTKIEKEKVFSKIFPGKPYKDSTLRLLMYYLYELVEKFLAYSRFNTDTFRSKDILLKELFERKLFKDFERIIDEANQELDKFNVRDNYYYENRYLFAEHKLSYLAEIYMGKYEKYLTKDNIQLFSDNITKFYLISVLKYYAITLNTMYLYNVKVDTEIIENILNNFNAEQFKGVPLILIYYRVIKLFIEPDNEENYYLLKDLIIKHDTELGGTIGDLFINLENYCVRQLRTGKQEYLLESFKIYELELKKDTYKTHGYMPNSFFSSMVVTASKLKKYDWLRKFIADYKNEIHEGSREAYYYYGMAYLENEEGNYEKALEYLAKSKPEEVYLKMDLRILQSRIYYSLVWTLPLQSLLDTFKKTVQNNKFMTDMRKNQYLKFIKYTNQLNNVRYKEDKVLVNELQMDLEKDEYFAYKLWIVEEAQKLAQ